MSGRDQISQPKVVVVPIGDALGAPDPKFEEKLSPSESLRGVWLGQPGALQLEVCEFVSSSEPTVQSMRAAWSKRRGKRSVPLIVFWQGPSHVLMTEPTGDPVAIVQLDPAAALAIVKRALQSPNREAVIQAVALLERAQGSGGVAGFRNRNLLSTHYLRDGFRRDHLEQWVDLDNEGAQIRSERGGKLLRALGYVPTAQPAVFEILSGGRPRVHALLLPDNTPLDRSTAGPGDAPATRALLEARTKGADRAVVVSGGLLRLYFTSSAQGMNDLSTAGAFIELDLDLLGNQWSALLTILFSAECNATGGLLDQVAEASERYAMELRDRFRERIYEEVVEDLVLALFDARGRKKADADVLFNATLRLLYRLLFVLYAEDRNLFPLGNPEYRRVSLTETLFRIDAMQRDGKPFDPKATTIWDDLFRVFDAIRQGNVEWNLPAYNGGLFEPDLPGSKDAAFLHAVKIPNAVIGPLLIKLAYDREGEEGGKVDFGDLGVRHLGTLYEGLLSFSVHIATQDLIINNDDMYVPAKAKDEPDVLEGEPYLTSPKGGRKASGSFYTPSFVVRRIIDTALTPTLEYHLQKVASLPIEQQWDSMLDFRVADPAMGSGHFLVDALDTIADRLALFLSDNPRIATDPITHARSQITAIGKQYGIDRLGQGVGDFELLRRNVMRSCIYGVDFNPMAVELAKLSLWLHAFVPGLPLSYLGHNLRHGNALVGIVGHEIAQQVEGKLFGSAVKSALTNALEQSKQLASLGDLSVDEVKRSERAQERLEDATSGLRGAFDAYACRAFATGDPSDEKKVRERGRALLEQADGLEQVLTGTIKGQDQRQIVKAQRVATKLAAFHWQLAFPEVFLRERAGFDVVLGNPPWEEATIERLQFWSQHFPGLRTENNAEQQRRMTRLEKQRPDIAKLFEEEQERAAEQRTVLTTGTFPGMGVGDPDLYKAFLWRFWQTCRDGGSCGFVSPRSAFSQSGAAEWRREVLPQSKSEVLFLRNYRQWVFADVNPGYDIAVATLHRTAPPALMSYGPISNVEQLDALNAGQSSRSILELVRATDPEYLCVPMLDSDAAVELFTLLASHPGVGARSRPDFVCAPVAELHATNDGRRVFTKDDRDHPVYNHLNVGHFRFDESVGAFAHANLEKAIALLYERRLGAPSKSILKAMPKAWLTSRETLPALNPRLAFRDVVHATNPRKVWAALVPPNTLLTNKAPYLVFAKGDVFSQAYVLGLLNSSILDWYAHHRVVLTLNFFIFNALPVPVMTPSALTQRVIDLAGQLAVRSDRPFGDWTAHFTPIDDEDQRREAIAELDAIVALMYGLRESSLPVIFTLPSRPNLETVLRYYRHWESADRNATFPQQC